MLQCYDNLTMVTDTVENFVKTVLMPNTARVKNCFQNQFTIQASSPGKYTDFFLNYNSIMLVNKDSNKTGLLTTPIDNYLPQIG